MKIVYNVNMETIEKFTARIPTDCLPYLINGDDSGGIEDELEEWIRKLDIHAKRRKCGIIISPDDTEEYFTWHPDIYDLGCTVQDCTILLVRPEKIK